MQCITINLTVVKRRFHKVRLGKYLFTYDVDKFKSRCKVVAQYALLTLLGIFLFYVTYLAVSGGTGSPGGEITFIMIPLLHYLIKKNKADSMIIIKELRGNEYE